MRRLQQLTDLKHSRPIIKNGDPMKTIKIILFVIATILMFGCSDQETEQELDCKNPRNKQEQQECAHKAFTKTEGPKTLPTNNKKW